eukprot:6371196-Alexandrium_andersonii.AAC.1
MGFRVRLSPGPGEKGALPSEVTTMSRCGALPGCLGLIRPARRRATRLRVRQSGSSLSRPAQ